MDSNSNDDEAYLQNPKFIERSKRWIVIVDDEEPIRMAVGDFLYDQGYQVTACADADSMLQLCSSSNEDLKDGALTTTIPDAIIR
jgi:DNA-binding response OmpR family regulator